MASRNRKRRSPDQRRAERRRRLNDWLLAPLRVMLLAAIGLGLGWGSYQVAAYLHTSAALAVRCIEVDGNSRTRLAELERAAGLREGVNIFSFDLDRARRRIEELPWVRDARLRRVVPDRIVVEVEEHQPAALISLEGLYVIDAHGEAFKRLQPGEAIDLPLITGLGREDFTGDPERSRSRVRRALALMERVERRKCLADRRLAEVHLDALLGTSLVLDPGAVTVRLGDRPEQRLGLLCHALAAIERHDLAPHTVLLDRGDRPHWATVRLEAGGDDMKNERAQRI
jgi:cell division protein FtsQ